MDVFAIVVIIISISLLTASEGAPNMSCKLILRMPQSFCFYFTEHIEVIHTLIGWHYPIVAGGMLSLLSVMIVLFDVVASGSYRASHQN